LSLLMRLTELRGLRSGWVMITNQLLLQHKT
jgi:hypothetical protein